MKISVIIPAHNEAASISDTIEQLESILKLEHELLVVNDHSTDDTINVVQEQSRKFPNVRLIHNHNRAGFANALRTGFNAASGELIVPVMADLCDDPQTIIKMYERIEQGYDIVCGSRYMQGGRKVGGPKLKTFFSRFVGLSLYLLIKVSTHDIANSFKMYRRDVLKSFELKASGFEISVEIPLKAYFAGFRISEIPTTWIDRKKGKSKFLVAEQGLVYLKLYLWALIKGLKTCLLKKK
ncbi:MAG: glycosyltransferase family 2 protein [Candidatus Omnitrophica bacterium]|nr:glycosyltransferase family 2 protein [Candidatus Omnitrophota bacterium]